MGIEDGVPQKQWIAPGELPPAADRKLKKLIERLKETDFVETLTVGGKDWDVYQSLNSGEMVFIAWRPTPEKILEVIVSNSMMGVKEALTMVNQ